MMMQIKVVFLLAMATGSLAMTVSLKEAEELPEELRPIMPGGSWFDDMAVKRLQMKHHELKELGKLEGHKHEEDPEEMFIMARLGAHHSVITIPEIGTPVTLSPHQKHDTREVMRNFLRHHTHHSSELRDSEQNDSHQNDSHPDNQDSEEDSKHRVSSSHEFMEIYERELENFFTNFMSAMLQAEIGGVSIETRGEDERPNRVASP